MHVRLSLVVGSVAAAILTLGACPEVVEGRAVAASVGDVAVERAVFARGGIDQPVPAGTLPPVEAWKALSALEREVSPAGLPRYERAAFGDWGDVDGNGCSTREDVLAYWLDALVGHGHPCVFAGVLADPYTGRTARVPGQVDIDHVVPLKEAWRAGAWRWDHARRVAFANDQRNLIPVYYKANRAKGDKPPHRWLPTATAYWCEYAVVYIGAKSWHGLTVTEEEAAALAETLLSCGPR